MAIQEQDETRSSRTHSSANESTAQTDRSYSSRTVSGGLVCQHALVLSTSIDGLWEISSSAIGIIFMGTPQYGSSLASYREKLAKGMKIVHTANKDMVGALHPDSNNVQLVGNEFQPMLRRGDLALKVFCLYEAKNMNGIVGKIVEENSAVLRGYENCSIDADHYNMTKFSGHADGGYGLVRSIITGWLYESRDCDAANKTAMSAFSLWKSCLVGVLDSGEFLLQWDYKFASFCLHAWRELCLRLTGYLHEI
ncbi:hypothetical protein N7519_010504 [Penicillium mononematosum]|uniref:uncharacterized protein n=1 Tax=Penicillium mononematosum TaxID=268346 RepID=UPI002548FDA5|nr:uncharacterized protein N7519_010504 [Penicillium mononematosum]KAJ6180043.1 hypothetical protein N7519_010504 [Penicillium mononematosum]